MESSEDDAGTATNASRRVSAREKDVGLAEDVNATSSLHQKPSEERSTNETPAMSEDNFDGDSVPSPSSQDVNTSTEAILDMIDEIVDGPDAPKRLPLSSECVDGLNEELAATSYNLNIIQDSVKSYIENIAPLQVVSPVNSVPVDSEIVIPGNIDTMPECSTLGEVFTNDVNTKSVDLLAASSSVLECEEKVVSTEAEDIVVSNVVTETSTNCPLPNIPSSSEEQTVQNVSDISVSEQQDRTVKCVTSSDTRDNVTVESAESTSSDSSVSESKVSFVEAQVRSPLRRRLVRPAPSDRRPDSTVSSTVDSQSNDNVITAEQSSSENIAKDVTSSSDAMPMKYDNVKPEEISNVSEINYCNAETSVSPKKIKLIRQKNITGISNRETPIDKSTVLFGNEQCQSTSQDNHSGNLSISTTESSSTASLLKSQDSYDNPVLENNCISEKQVKPPSVEKENCNENSQSTKAVQSTPDRDDNQQAINCEKISTVESYSVLLNDNTCHSEQEPHSLPRSNSSKQMVDTKTVDLEQSYSYSTQDNEDYIPLHLPPKNTVYQSKNSDLKSRTEKPDHGVVVSIITEDGTKTQELKSSSEQESQSNKFEADIEPKCHKVDCDVLKGQIQSTSSDKKSCLIMSENIEPESRNIEVESNNKISMSCAPKLESSQPDSCTSKLIRKSDKSDVEVSETDSKGCDVESNNSMPISKIEDLTINSDKTIELEFRSGKPDLKNTEVLAKERELSLSCDQQSKCSLDSNMCKSESFTTLTIESNKSELDLKLHPKHSACGTASNQMKDSIPDAQLSDAQLEICEFEPSSSTTQLQSAQFTSQETELKSSCSTVQLQSAQCTSQEAELESSSSTPQLQSAQCTSQDVELESSCSTAKLPSAQCTSQEVELESKHVEQVPRNREVKSSIPLTVNCEKDIMDQKSEENEWEKKVPPIKLNLSKSSISESKLDSQQTSINKEDTPNEESDSTKQVPKLTIKLKQPEEIKSPVPKLTIKPIRPPVEQEEGEKVDNTIQVPCVTKINIKPIVKPAENVNEKLVKSQSEVDKDIKLSVPGQVPCITKLNIKPILKPPEKINDIHRKSSSSEISESECSENDETTSTSDQTSASDHGPSDVVPKVTIKLGKPGTESEGKFYTEKNVPKLTIKGIQQEEKLIISQSDEIQPEKIPKLTIKTVTKCEAQPLSPKLTIKPLKPPDSPNKVKMSTDLFSTSEEGKEISYVPKITIKPVTRMDGEPRTPKKSTAVCDSSENIRAVTKLNIKPVLKPADSGEPSEGYDNKVPVVSKLNIKPVIKPKDNDVDCSVDEVPKITKLNIKPLKNPEDNSSKEKDCDELNAVIDGNSIPVVTKINIKPIVKPQEEKEKDSENLSSETGNSSDDNGDHIPVVTKLNIKPIMKPDEAQESSKVVPSNEQSIPVVTKLNIKPLIKPGESSPSSPKKEHKIDAHSTGIPVVTKLNIKPVIRPEDAQEGKLKDDNEDKLKNPPLVMKINMKSVVENVNHESANEENICSDETLGATLKRPQVAEKSSETNETKSHESESVEDCLESKLTVPSSEEKVLKLNCVPESTQKHEENDRISVIKKQFNLNTSKVKENLHSPGISNATKCNFRNTESPTEDLYSAKEGKSSLPNETEISQDQKNINFRYRELTETSVKQPYGRQKISVQNCTLLKKLLENTRDNLDKKVEVSQAMNCTVSTDRSESTIPACKNFVNSDHMVDSGKSVADKTISLNREDKLQRSSTPDKINDLSKIDSGKFHSIQELTDKVIDNITKPLEISISDKMSNQSSGQDSPRIILKINKTDHGPLAKIITEDVKRPDTPENYTENTQDNVNDKLSPKKHVANRRKQASDTTLNLSTGKRLRSSRIVETTEKSQIKRQIGKRPSTAEPTTPQNKDAELSILQAKRLKLGQLLSVNKSLSPAVSPQISPTKPVLEPKSVNHSLLNNENCSKNGNSKLHNILSNLQAKQIQSLAMHCSDKTHTVPSDIECNTSISSSDTTEVVPAENSHIELQQMIINENSDFRDLPVPEESSQDPLEVATVKPAEVAIETIDIPKPVELTPQPKKRGRPRKLPVSEGAKPVVTLPVTALEERPQRSLRLMRDRPTIIHKPRGRGRGRGGRRSEIATSMESPSETIIEPAHEEPGDERSIVEIDPTSSRIKLPRMTEALDKMPSMCQTPLSSRRRSSSATFSMGDTHGLKDSIDSPVKDEFLNTPEPSRSGRPRGGRGSRGGRVRTPRGRGRGRGGGRGAMYMKETMGIYGRVCGPATTTVQLFEEETCMMDDNATSAKPSHLLDEDSQSSVKSSTNESNKLKKSKFADLFDSNKVWTAADVKEYTWPPPEKADGEQKVMMIQEQVAMFLGVKSFKRRYPELKRRTICGEERDYVLSKGLVTEALCDLGK
ncbi:unnamed protein product [Arctia plantaginis]|uniref:PHD finger protein 10 n=1 Tax=Arctia plantaginis TaxID=874455 RepID=A0A8S1BB25_ARCPL|nr:unnamed protein product [Arctia plantaginis]